MERSMGYVFCLQSTIPALVAGVVLLVHIDLQLATTFADRDDAAAVL